MSTTETIGLLALAIGTSEATGVTNLTGIGGDSSDGDGDPNGGFSPGLDGINLDLPDIQLPETGGSSPVVPSGFSDSIGLASQIGSLQSSLENIDSGGPSEETIINLPSDFSGGVSDGVSSEFNQQTPDAPMFPDNTEREQGDNTGGSSGGFLEGVGTFLEDPSGVAEDAGEEIGRTPVAFGAGVSTGIFDGLVDTANESWEQGQNIGDGLTEFAPEREDATEFVTDHVQESVSTEPDIDRDDSPLSGAIDRLPGRGDMWNPFESDTSEESPEESSGSDTSARYEAASDNRESEEETPIDHSRRTGGERDEDGMEETPVDHSRRTGGIEVIQ